MLARKLKNIIYKWANKISSVFLKGASEYNFLQNLKYSININTV